MKNVSYKVNFDTTEEPENYYDLKNLIPGTFPSAFIQSLYKTYDSIIEDVFEEDSDCLMVLSVQESADFNNDRLVEVSFRDTSGNLLDLRCSVDWFLKTPGPYNKILLGIKILNPSADCRQFIKEHYS